MFDTQSSSEAQHEKARGVIWSILDYIETNQKRMIVGIFKFTFWYMPKTIWEILDDWAPTLLKLCKVLFLLCFWLTLVIGPPVIYGWMKHRVEMIEVYLNMERELSLSNDISSIMRVLSKFFYIMYEAIFARDVFFNVAALAIVVVGSIWGLYNVRKIAWSRNLIGRFRIWRSTKHT